MDTREADLRAVAEMLDEVLQLEEQAWPAWLARQTEMPPHRLAMLREMLAAEARGACALPPLPSYSAAELSSPATAASPDALAGAEVGPYRLLRELGRGGMGSVWLAERIDGSLKRQVALKLPHTTLPHRQLAERFGRERDILAALVHPHIARLYDAGLTAQGHPYLALEYVDGRPLLDYCRAAGLDLPARLALFQQVLSAVQYAHGQLVVHRDLKPGNILVTATGEVRLLDFGIAKLLIDGEAKETALTQLGGRALTPQYAAPEQILGQAIGTAADVYGLGVVLYELLTGTLPYRLRRDTRLALEEAIINADVVPPSQAARTAAGAIGRPKALRGDLDTIVLKALKRNPADRYATVAAFADDITRYLKGEPVAARPDSTWYRGGKFLLRHRLGIAMTALAVLALAIGLGGALWQANVAHKEARTATAVKEFMQSLFLANTAQQDDPQRGREMTARELLDIGAAKVEQALADAPEAKVQMLEMFATLYHQLGLSGRAAEFGQRWIAAARETYGPESLQLVMALGTTAAIVRYLAKDHPAQRPMLEEAAQILDRRGEQDTETRGLLLFASSIYWQDHDFPRAWAAAQRALELLGASASSGLASMIAARFSAMSGDPALARKLATEGIASVLKHNRLAKPGDGLQMSLPILYQVSAEAAWALGDLTEAERQFRLAWSLSTRTLGASANETIAKGGLLAEFLLLTGQVAEGRTLLAQFADRLSALIAEGGSPPDYEALEAIGRAQSAAGDHAQALDTLSMALGLRPGIDASAPVAGLLRRQVKVFLALDRREEAKQALERAMAMRIKSGLENPSLEREETELLARVSAPIGR